MNKKDILAGEHFLNGDVACAEGAIAAGCRLFAGYPITPQSEITETMAHRLPTIGGFFLQMEDELASIAAVLGGAWGGMKAMTATSGPGFSLMMENLGLGIMTETPCVIVDVQRGGPSTGLPTATSQADMMQARWGTHGDHEIIAYAPASPQEMFDQTIKAFNQSERYRQPVLVMADEVVGHMMERVVIDPDKIEIYPRRKPSVPYEEFLPYRGGADMVPEMACAGEGYRVHVTGLTHDERGYPDLSVESQDALMHRLIGKIRDNADQIIEVEEENIRGADVVLVTYGIAARTSLRAMELAEQKGIKVGMLRLITVWPFPLKEVRKIAGAVKGIVVPELNLGQIVREVERAAAGQCPVRLVGHAGGGLHRPEDILTAIEEVA
ncbi:2-oxoacid:acceptor oxidoreductase subunit alpha [Candidatus Bipolaricaulota bacterium]|nr:2-oxoacid:acceptor oxidoreductase subunit alpha [Candidatus Bipolaricaulota bacterium]